MQMDLLEYKVLHMTFELIRIWICIKIQVIKHLETSLNLENDALSYSHQINYSDNLPIFTYNLLHLTNLQPIHVF